jgi:murein DD-endopeptidase MepM/ murein hydrolase activator NlpD
MAPRRDDDLRAALGGAPESLLQARGYSAGSFNLSESGTDILDFQHRKMIYAEQHKSTKRVADAELKMVSPRQQSIILSEAQRIFNSSRFGKRFSADKAKLMASRGSGLSKQGAATLTKQELLHRLAYADDAARMYTHAHEMNKSVASTDSMFPTITQCLLLAEEAKVFYLDKLLDVGSQKKSTITGDLLTLTKRNLTNKWRDWWDNNLQKRRASVNANTFKGVVLGGILRKMAAKKNKGVISKAALWYYGMNLNSKINREYQGKDLADVSADRDELGRLRSGAGSLAEEELLGGGGPGPGPGPGGGISEAVLRASQDSQTALLIANFSVLNEKIDRVFLKGKIENKKSIFLKLLVNLTRGLRDNDDDDEGGGLLDSILNKLGIVGGLPGLVTTLKNLGGVVKAAAPFAFAASAAWDIGSAAFDTYNAFTDENSTVEQKGGAVGSLAGATIGTVAGAILGGPIGAAIGAKVGSWAGEWVGETVAPWVASLWDGTTEDIEEEQTSWWDDNSTWLEDTEEQLRESSKSLLKGVEKQVTDGLNNLDIPGTIEDVSDKVDESLAFTKTSLTTAKDTLSDFLEDELDIKDRLEDQRDFAEESWKSLRSTVSGSIEAVTAKATESWEDIKDLNPDIAKDLEKKASGVADFAEEAWAGVNATGASAANALGINNDTGKPDIKKPNLYEGGKLGAAAFYEQQALDITGLSANPDHTPSLNRGGGATEGAASSGAAVAGINRPTNSNVITSPFGPRSVPGGSKYHEGIDLRARMGDPIFAMKEGIVTNTGGAFNTISVNHGDGLSTNYLHLSSVNVNRGQQVKGGDVLGKSGGMGRNGPNSYQPHLHFEVLRGGQRMDPEPFLASAGVSLSHKGGPGNEDMAPLSDVDAIPKTGKEQPAEALNQENPAAKDAAVLADASSKGSGAPAGASSDSGGQAIQPAVAASDGGTKAAASAAPAIHPQSETPAIQQASASTPSTPSGQRPSGSSMNDGAFDLPLYLLDPAVQAFRIDPLRPIAG